jgi:hypothetical protein
MMSNIWPMHAGARSWIRANKNAVELLSPLPRGMNPAPVQVEHAHGDGAGRHAFS